MIAGHHGGEKTSSCAINVNHPGVISVEYEGDKQFFKLTSVDDLQLGIGLLSESLTQIRLKDQSQLNNVGFRGGNDQGSQVFCAARQAMRDFSADINTAYHGTLETLVAKNAQSSTEYQSGFPLLTTDNLMRNLEIMFGKLCKKRLTP